MAPFTVHGNTVDPASPNAPAPAKDAANTLFIVVQAKQPLNNLQKLDLQKHQLEIIEYLGSYAYLCRYPPSDLKLLRGKQYLEHVDVYQSSLKIWPELRDRPVASDRAAPATLGAAAATSSQEAAHIKVMIALHKKSRRSSADTAEDLFARGIISKQDTEIYNGRINTSISKDKLEEIAKVDEVRAIEPLLEIGLHIDRARTVLNDCIYIEDPISGLPKEYTGADEVILIADTGFDKGDLKDVHPAFFANGEAGTSRLLAVYDLFPNQESFNDTDGHGTHVAGCALADGLTTSMAGPDTKSPGRLRGTAPGAQFVATRVIKRQSPDPQNPNQEPVIDPYQGPLAPLLDTPYNTHNVRVSNHSYGPHWNLSMQPPYLESNRDIDDYIFEKPDLLLCWAAGNLGNQRNTMKKPQQICGEAISKNVLTIGATYSPRKINFVKGAYDPSQTSEANAGMVATFSSRGPAAGASNLPMEDQDKPRYRRQKPDVCAPGVAILSARSRDKSAARGSRADGLDASTDSDYCFESGTSMATPLVTGCAAVLRQVLREQRGVALPSAALLKALLINGATDVPIDDSAISRGGAGWGRVNMTGSLQSVILPSTNPMGGFIDVSPTSAKDKLLDMFDEKQVLTISVPPTEETFPDSQGDSRLQTLKVTLVWTDRGGAALQNELVLMVQHDKRGLRIGNQGDRDMTRTPNQYDEINNVQQVLWSNIPEGRVYVTVKCLMTAQLDAASYAVAWSLE